MAKKVAAKKAAAKKAPPPAKKPAAKKTAPPPKPAAKKAAAAPKPQPSTKAKETAMTTEDSARGSIVKLRVPYNAQTLTAVAARLGKKKLLRRELQDHLMDVVRQYLLDSGAPVAAAPEPAQAALPLASVDDADDLLG